MEIIDFHTHPFIDDETNICSHKEYFNITPEGTVDYLKGMGITKICGSVATIGDNGMKGFDKIKNDNNKALKLKELYGEFYVPGFHIHPAYVKESMEEMERMHKLGVNLIGELVPYISGWEDYAVKGLSELLDLAEDYSMVVNFHSMDQESMNKMVSEHKNLTFIAAHPGEYNSFMGHLERMRMSENYYLDLSGTGLFRHGMLRRGINECGVERFIFGSDYPTCNPAMFIGGVMNDSLITDSEKEAIFSGNIKRILNI